MKRISLIFAAALVTIFSTSAQIVDDALRYSQIFYNGTARFNSMGGAFTALGGDISTLSQNPGGLGVFRSSEITFTPQLYHIKNSAGFYGISEDYLYNFNLGQAGIVNNIISNNNESGLITLNVGYSFNKTNNFNSSTRIQGTSNTSSMADYWADISLGTDYRDLTGNAGLAYDAWIMDTITGSGARAYGTVFSNYGDNPPSVYGQNIRRIVTDEGYSGEHAISVGGNWSNKFYFGATLGINRIRYTGHYEHLEAAGQPMLSGFENFTYTDHYENTGTGFALKLGTIIKPVETVRLGLAFHSPTFYRINEYFYDNMSSNFENNEHYEFENEPLRYNYALTTPFRALAGVAVQVKKIALLSADYEFVDYSAARFSETGDNYDYSEKNLEIKNILKSAGNLRFGAEFRMDKLYLRGGYGYYGKVFKLGELNENLDHNSISFGAGFREKNLSIDFSYTNFSGNRDYILYNTSYESALADIETRKNIFAVTVGYKFGY
ncbi:MAG: hypothetical protein RBR81_03845 [Bacteroidales bacterium]|jgi:hypothetical protein|nr:hypothetical protein [Bacteroidales bacterium]